MTEMRPRTAFSAPWAALRGMRGNHDHMSLVAGVPRPVFSGESTRVLDTMCASFRRKNSIPLLGNHLGFHFFLEGGGSLS